MTAISDSLPLFCLQKNNLESELKSHLHNLKQRNNFLEFQKTKN